ncbi:MAG: hypothetical protein ACMUEL_00445 [Flavobacteriales bacterium Tduv]
MYVVEDQKEEGGGKLNQSKKRKGKKKAQSGVDTQEKWLKRSGKLYYGYRKHIGVDKNAMILAVHSVAPNEHDSIGVNY